MADKILLVDDDGTLLSLLSRYLRQEAYSVLAASSGTEALRLAYQERPALVVLDVMMPGMDGWELCARLRELASFPIILLSAKSSEADKLRGFQLGVDDYVTKPFSLAELAARIRVVLERHRPKPSTANAMYTTGNWSVDMVKRRVTRGDERVPLTPTEFRLLQYLIEQHGRPVSEATLAQEVWGSHPEGELAVVRRYIWLLRQKLEDDPAHPTRILTVRGFGYRLGTAPLAPLEDKK
jgi:DNA-binding response OmpR family regulator